MSLHLLDPGGPARLLGQDGRQQQQQQYVFNSTPRPLHCNVRMQRKSECGDRPDVFMSVRLFFIRVVVGLPLPLFIQATASRQLLANNNAGQSTFGNLMTDRRIVRGSNYNLLQSGLLDGSEGDAARGARAAAARRRAVARRRVPGAPGAAPGAANRRNEPVQTDPYLEELYDKGREMEIGIQTDLELEPIEAPEYVPSATGNDAATQIVPGELYDFETEVEPVLQVLVDQTIEQALAECLEEEELAQLRMQAAAADELREQAVASARHRQRHLQRIMNDKDKRAEYEDEINERLQTERRAAATALVKTHLPPLLPSVVDTLREQGYMGESNNEMDETFMSWLQAEVIQEVEGMITNREVILDIVKDVIETRAELYRAMGEDETISSSAITSDISQKNESDQLEEGENLEEEE